MKIIDRYILIIFLKSALVAMTIFIALSAFLTLIDELGDTGRGSYTTLVAVEYTFLVMPRVAYELFPIVAVIAAMATLGILSSNSELVILRTSGVSLLRISWSLIRGGILIALLAVLVGEYVVPICEQTAQQLRSVAISDQIAIKTRNGFWSRDGDNFINIKRVLPGDQVEEIYVYEFDDQNNLASATYAKRANYIGESWRLEQIEKSIISRSGIEIRQHVNQDWTTLLNPKLINLITIKPRYLTLRELYKYITYLKENNQNTLQYQQALFSKLVRPVTIIALILLAVPLVKSDTRSISVSQRVFVGSVIGIAFHLFNQIAAQMGVVYAINPFISATVPTIAILALTLWLIKRSA